MSDSEDSESFLSADEGDADAGNVSSDITLSSDSEPDGEGKAAPGDADSSDITLSSDEDDDDDKCTGPSGKIAAKGVDDAKTAAKDEKRSGSDVQTKTVVAKKSGSADVGQYEFKVKPSPKLGQTEDESSLSFSLPPADKEPHEKRTTTSTGPPNAADLGSTELSLKSETAESPVCGNISPSPVEEAPISEASEVPPTTEKPPPPVTTTSESKGMPDPHTAPTLTHAPSSDAPGPDAPSPGVAVPDASSPDAPSPDAVEGWADLDEEITLPNDSAADAAGETSDSGWTADAAQSASLGEPTSTDPPEKTLTPAGRAALAVSRTASQPSPPPTTPPEPSQPKLEPSTEEPSAIPPEPSPPPAEPAKPLSEPAAPPAEPAPERRRPERKERRGPLKLGAKKLGTKLAVPVTQPPTHSEPAAAAGGGSSGLLGGGGAGSSERATTAAFSSQQQEQVMLGGH